MRYLRSLLLSLSSGAVLMFFSEHLFWARARPGDTLANWAATWLAYSLLAFVLMTAIRHYRVRSLEALFVAGALVGWLGEGVLVQTLYDRLPLQISWTGLAWHSLISVCIGWYGMRRALAAPQPRLAAALAAALGVFWGLWAIFWRLEEPTHMVSLPAFAAFAFITTGILGLSLWVFERVDPGAFQPSRGLVVAALAAWLAIFGLGTLPAAPVSILVLPGLLALVLLALARNRANEAGPDLLQPLGSGGAPGQAYLALACMPAIASLIYAAALAFDLRWQTNWLVYLVTMPAGFVFFLVAWIRLMRRRSICA